MFSWFKSKSIFLKIFLSTSFLLLLIALFWLFTFSFTILKLRPVKSAVIANASPKISANWLMAFGAKIKKAQITVDGKDVSKYVHLTQRGFIFKSKRDLNEGTHVVQAKLKYGWLYPRTVDLNWRFITDTTPPQLTFEDGSPNLIASSKTILRINGRTEPYASFKLKLNDTPIYGPQVGSNGNFTLNLFDLQKRNRLHIVATDKAGNRTKLTIPVVLDQNAPSILTFSPGPNAKIFGSSQDFLIKLAERETIIRGATLEIDGKAVPFEFDKKAKTIKYHTEMTEDGNHTANLKVFDAANNINQKSWHFTLDTTSIVVSRSQRTLTLLKQGKVFKTLSVAVGQPAYPTPLGHWQIVGKDKFPAWFNPHSSWSHNMPNYIPPGYNNPLGIRAMYLNVSGITIHGTNNIGSIGTPASHGCIRVANSQIPELFDLVPVGTPVDVVD